jgi:hypothetical protein
MMETEATREPDEERPKRRSLSMEDLTRKYLWWPNGGGREGHVSLTGERVGMRPN